ncbi:33919_t:CDS:2, partial [Gigaspora margarita]
HLDEIWGIIERAIIEAANKSLPKKKVSNFRHTKAKEFNQTYMQRPILQISRWMRFIRDRLGLSIEETNKLEFNLTIKKINTDLQLEIHKQKTSEQRTSWWTLRVDQFRQRRTNLSEEYRDWQEVYEPKTTIKEEWYNGLNKEILEEEWVDMLKKLKEKSVPGQSGITYTLIRAASTVAHKVFQKFLSLCIYSANVRPIALLETFRKRITKIYTDRFARIIINKNILRGLNFASLPDNSTESPIHVLNTILEDAHWEKKELWKQVISLYKRLNSTGTETLATELRLRQGFNNARIVNIMSKGIEVPLQLFIRTLANRTRWNTAKCSSWKSDRRNRKLAPEYVISGYNSLALSIALLVVSLDKRKKELVLVENKNDDRKIFKIMQKSKAKILGELYCNIPLVDPNQFEIKKCKGCSKNTAKMTKKVNKKEGKRILNWDEKRTSKKFKFESPTNSLNESLLQGLLSIECLEIELLKKQKLSKAL